MDWCLVLVSALVTHALRLWLEPAPAPVPEEVP